MTKLKLMYTHACGVLNIPNILTSFSYQPVICDTTAPRLYTYISYLLIEK